VSWILLTNDDGIDAPGLPALAHALQGVAPVRVVVPDRERSWVGKAVSRFDPVRVDTAERGGITMHTASGYPADCAQLGVHALFEDPPELVVSGINIGYNHGSAYLQSSGTVGAAIEASIAGVDAIAFSAGSTRLWKQWRPWVHTPDALEMWRRLADLAAVISGSVWAARPSGVVLTVNFPDTADTSTERRITSIAHVGYERLFSPSGPDEYVHDFGGGTYHRRSLEGTDVEAAADGAVSITPIGLIDTEPLPDHLRRSLLG
jgi:5'-nucleotidase